MTSEERHAARRARREAARAKKRAQYSAPYDRFETVTDLNHLIRAAKMSCKGVWRKASVQKYMMNLLSNSAEARRKLLAGEDVRQGFIEFDIHERGKKRHIRAMHMKERVIQRCLCDRALVPMLRRGLVYDNGASMKGKGIHFALNRMKKMLRRHARKHGTHGYALMVDFHGYFDNIEHGPVRTLLDKTFADARIRALTRGFVEAFGGKSLGIGSQVSQILAVAYPNRADHRMKEAHRLGMSARYMDDTCVLCAEREPLEALLKDVRGIWEALGIRVSEGKTRILPVRRFTFMKARFRILETGRVLMLPGRASYRRMRRKLRSFRRFVDEGVMTAAQARTSYMSWRGYQGHFDGRRAVRRMDGYFRELFEREAA